MTRPLFPAELPLDRVQKYQRTITKNDGTDFKINYQEAEIRRQGKPPKPIEITVPRSGAYVEGLYTLGRSAARTAYRNSAVHSTILRELPSSVGAAHK